MALEGKIVDFGVADILQLISQQQKTGVLIVERSDQSIEVLFWNGMIISAHPIAKAEKELIEKAKAGKLVEKKEKAIPAMENLRKFNVLVDGEYFAVEVDAPGGSPRISSVTQYAPAPAPVPQPTPTPVEVAKPAASKPAAATVDDKGGTPLVAPMPGMIVGVEKKEGDTVNEGEAVLILEAMKMENALGAPISGTITKINLGVGDHVAKNDILCVIAP